MKTIQEVVIDSAEDRTALAEALRDFAFACRNRGLIGCDRHGDATRACSLWQQATGERIHPETLARLCNAHGKPGLACC